MKIPLHSLHLNLFWDALLRHWIIENSDILFASKITLGLLTVANSCRRYLACSCVVTLEDLARHSAMALTPRIDRKIVERLYGQRVDENG